MQISIKRIIFTPRLYFVQYCYISFERSLSRELNCNHFKEKHFAVFRPNFIKLSWSISKPTIILYFVLRFWVIIFCVISLLNFGIFVSMTFENVLIWSVFLSVYDIYLAIINFLWGGSMSFERMIIEIFTGMKLLGVHVFFSKMLRVW